MPAPVRVVVVDDHDIVRGGVRVVVESEGDIVIVGEAASAADGLAVIRDLDPDVAVVDPTLPDGSGIDLVARVAQAAPRTRCLVLASDDDTPTVLAALNAGATGYLRKDVGGEVLRTTVRTLAGGHSAFDPATFRRLLAHMEQPGPAAPELAGLSDQQQRILALIGEGLSNREIGEQLYLAEQTVKNNVTRILAGLGVQRRTQAALIASRVYGR